MKNLTSEIYSSYDEDTPMLAYSHFNHQHRHLRHAGRIAGGIRLVEGANYPSSILVTEKAQKLGCLNPDNSEPH